VTSSCAGKIGLREPGEHARGPNLVSRDNVAHNRNLYTVLETPPLVHADDLWGSSSLRPRLPYANLVEDGETPLTSALATIIPIHRVVTASFDQLR
jgi:hypothetical protein